MKGQNDYAFCAGLDVPYEEALREIEVALKSEGFGVLTSVDMQATLKEKLGAQFRKYSILGVCNPPLAQRALSQNLDAGLVLPCTIVVYEDGDGARISVADPMVVIDLLHSPGLRPIAEEAQARLKRVFDRIVSTERA
jgi:uncharacterized protein (DUF302 family)